MQAFYETEFAINMISEILTEDVIITVHFLDDVLMLVMSRDYKDICHFRFVFPSAGFLLG